MKILRLLNKKNFSIILTLLFGLVASAEEQPVDIWNVDKSKIENNPSNLNNSNSNNSEKKSSGVTDIYKMQDKNKNESIELEENFNFKETKIFGLYDPEDHDLDIDMWLNSDGDQLKNIFSKLNKINLSDDATEIMKISLLTIKFTK